MLQQNGGSCYGFDSAKLRIISETFAKKFKFCCLVDDSVEYL